MREEIRNRMSEARTVDDRKSILQDIIGIAVYYMNTELIDSLYARAEQSYAAA